MAEEGRVRRKALTERLKAKRHAKEAELDRRGGGERARCDQDADITRLEELEIEVRIRVSKISLVSDDDGPSTVGMIRLRKLMGESETTAVLPRSYVRGCMLLSPLR